MAVPSGCSAATAPEYPDMNGKRRERARVEMLEREIGFLEEELKSVESLQVASTFCKEVAEFVVANADPMIPTNKKNHRSSRVCFSRIGCCCCAAKCCHGPLINNPCECDCCKCIRFSCFTKVSSCTCQLLPCCCCGRSWRCKFLPKCPKVLLCCSCRNISCDPCGRCRLCF